MKVLVTGGAGFIGSHTVDQLLRQGYEVRVLDALIPPVHSEGEIPDYLPIDNIEFIHDDVRNKLAWVNALRDINAVIHLAAYQDYLPNFSHFFDVNTVGTALLYEVIVENKFPIEKVIIASSQAIYGEAKYHCLNLSCPLSNTLNSQTRYPPLREESQLRRGEWGVLCPGCGHVLQWVETDEAVINPHNQYAMSKYTQEMIALNLGQRYQIPTVCMRYSIVQGARQSFRNAYSGVLRIFTQRLLNDQPPVCYEDGKQVRDYVSVQDVVRANLLILNEERADFEVFNVGGDREVTVEEYAKLVSRISNKDIEPVIPGKYRFGDTRHVISDIEKIKSLGWYPQVALDEIVKEYIEWALVQPGFSDFYTEAEREMEAVGTLRSVI